MVAACEFKSNIKIACKWICQKRRSVCFKFAVNIKQIICGLEELVLLSRTPLLVKIISPSFSQSTENIKMIKQMQSFTLLKFETLNAVYQSSKQQFLQKSRLSSYLTEEALIQGLHSTLLNYIFRPVSVIKHKNKQRFFSCCDIDCQRLEQETKKQLTVSNVLKIKLLKHFLKEYKMLKLNIVGSEIQERQPINTDQVFQCLAFTKNRTRIREKFANKIMAKQSRLSIII
ncbi:unnamed protein product [Paramecium octaurelia]|uniref:Uncharacterized protein n=1 Tax=Paramecium octaurelia TaxID=43137 RepID=A0A8S1YLN6_PAROT|nr:unnamed protein product [Paramecium octaurelia]